MNRLLIAIDAGHGGKDPGATANGLLEKEITLQLTLKTGLYLRAHYACEVMYTRNRDVFLTLSERVTMANRAKADLFLSFHINSFNKVAKGFESYRYPGTTGKTLELQRQVHGEVMEVLKNYKISDRGMKQGNFAVVRDTIMPALLTETLFISNPTEAQFLRSEEFLDRVAQAHAVGLAKAAGLKSSGTSLEKKHYLMTGTFQNKAVAEKNAQMLKEEYGWFVSIHKA